MIDLSAATFAAYWDGPEMATNTLVFLNLLGALFLGLIVGYERSYHGRAAGMRTYGLVCMASAALTVISGYPSYWFGGLWTSHAMIDPTRTIQGIVTGIGFLGAGIIMKDGLNISGLTTAASIWAASAIGVLIGVGFYPAAILLTILSAAFMWWGSNLESLLPSRHALGMILNFRENFTPREEEVRRFTLEHGYELAKGSITVLNKNGKIEWRVVAISQGKRKSLPLIELSNHLPNLEGLESFQLSHARN